MEQPEHLIMNWRSVAMAIMIMCALVAQVYLWSKGIERRATLWFALFILAVAIDTIPIIIGFAGAYDIWPGLTFLPTNLSLIFGPLLYFHARQLMAGIAPISQF